MVAKLQSHTKDTPLDKSLQSSNSLCQYEHLPYPKKKVPEKSLCSIFDWSAAETAGDGELCSGLVLLGRADLWKGTGRDRHGHWGKALHVL